VNRCLFAVVACLALAACHTIRYDTGRAASPRKVERTIHFTFWGLGNQPAVVDLDAACPEGAARWRSESTAGDWLLSVVTIGIYAPRTVTIECVEVAR
jgi:hypothetical protein